MEIILEGKCFELTQEKCSAMHNDEAKPVEGIDIDMLLAFGNAMDPEAFSKEYYREDCEGHEPAPRAKKELVPYWEGHYYLYTKKQKPVMTSVSPEYADTSFDRLLKSGTVDDSYIVTFILCPVCGLYQIHVDQLDI